MADVIRKATNKFTKGLVMDFSPENTGNEVLTHALNATLLTFNGNELSLQNDQGNARVETAYLPEGYIPVGTCEYGGIIYIVSYNPLEDKSQIGCFPSPERNISSDELGKTTTPISKSDFQNTDSNGDLTGEILHNSHLVLLKDDKLNPGDKFIICADSNIYNESLADLLVDKDSKYYESNPEEDPDGFEFINHPIIALNVVSVEDSGKIVYLNSDLRNYEYKHSYNIEGSDVTDVYKYPILGTAIVEGQTQLNQADLDAYRTTLSSGYSVFKSKTSGKLAILAELIMIDAYSVTHSIKPSETEEGKVDVFIHTEVSPELTTSNYNLVPKLKYYYLKNSQGYIELVPNPADTNDIAMSNNIYRRPLFVGGEVNDHFLQTNLQQLYVSDEVNALPNKTLQDTGQFLFPKPNTYHGRVENASDEEISGTGDSLLYTKFTEGGYHKIYKDQIQDLSTFRKLPVKFYKYNSSEEEYSQLSDPEEFNETITYWIKDQEDNYKDAQRDMTHKDKQLYRLKSSDMLPATATERYDVTIQKYWETTVDKGYIPLTYAEALLEREVYVFDQDEQGYMVAVGQLDPSTQYYRKEVENILIPLPYDFKVEDYAEQPLYYFPTKVEYEPVDIQSQEYVDYWDFTKYPIKGSDEGYGYTEIFYWNDAQDIYVKATEEQKQTWQENNIILYYYSEYERIAEDVLIGKPADDLEPLFVVFDQDQYLTDKHFIPSPEYNYIAGYNYGGTNDRPWSQDLYPKDDPLYVYKISDFLPSNFSQNNENRISYDDVKLASLKIPGALTVNNTDLYFTYDYTIVPCMNYGRLDHLAVSNTINFSNLYQFNNSNFTTWKYRIDGNQLRLNVGADIYDTFSTKKVEGLILEFYDLWGFAGSLEISGKKSYSGKFTKLLDLNTLGALSSNKITQTNTITSTYSRSINIQEVKQDGSPSTYTLNNEKVIFKGYDLGWFYENGDPIEPELNDCGTLYPNLIYGVKAYFKISEGGQETYTFKKQMFLFTLPIYNDYYYNVDDFNTLGDPTLDLMMTFKLEDSSEILPYNGTPYSGDLIEDGYDATDLPNVTKYLSGFYDQDSLNLTRYYKYQGQSKLRLEVGLKKDYEEFGLGHDAEGLNKLFSCTLSLVGNDEYPLDIEGDYTNKEDLLNYKPNWKFATLNKMSFSTGSTLTIKAGDFDQYNFIKSDKNYIPINYEFVVGYKAYITNIVETAVKATTVCALCHQTDGVYNLEDFNVYDNNDNKYSNTVFFNSGDVDNSNFGVCRQIGESGNIQEQCSEIASVYTATSKISTPGKLNAGDPIKQMSQYVGKLAFCQPLIHAVDEENGVNIQYYYNDPNKIQYNYSISTGIGGGRKDDPDTNKKWSVGSGADDTFGIIPMKLMFDKPLYNMVLNTKNTLQYYGEFISTIDYAQPFSPDVLHGDTSNDKVAWNNVNTEGKPYRRKVIPFTGLTGTQLKEFNTKLIKTMQSVYAYNPDYDSLIVNKGNVTVDSNDVKFISNILSSKASLDLTKTTFNDLIGISGIQMSYYLSLLSKYSGDVNKIQVLVSDEDSSMYVSQVNFLPNFLYCGSDTSNYLVSSLTYNTSVVKKLSDELQFNVKDTLVIKHHDGTQVFSKGTIDKKSLYGYLDSSKKLITLDVGNYTIGRDGTLELKSDFVSETKPSTPVINEATVPKFFDSGQSFTRVFSDETVTWTVKLQCTDVEFLKCNGENPNQVYLVVSPRHVGRIWCSVQIESSNPKYRYSTVIKEFSLYCTSNRPIIATKDQLEQLSSEQLKILIETGTVDRQPWADQDVIEQGIYIQLKKGDDGKSYTIQAIRHDDQPIQPTNYDSQILYLIDIQKIRVDINQHLNLDKITDSVINLSKTSNYASSKGNQYTILSEYQSSCFIGTRITVNDLIYEPVVDGHRLFIKSENLKFDNTYYPVLYYRALDPDGDNTTVNSSWNYKDTKYKNCLFLYTGPCFTESSLETHN